MLSPGPISLQQVLVIWSAKAVLSEGLNGDSLFLEIVCKTDTIRDMIKHNFPRMGCLGGSHFKLF